MSEAPIVMMGNIRLRQAIPTRAIEQISPFILLHHFDFEMNAGENKFSVPAHPHRGFCPITFMFEGSVQHNDSLGNSESIHDNEVQWINAARGIIHSEVAEAEFVKKGGRFHGIQLWINLRSEDKMKPATYQAITKNEIELIEEDGVEFRLVSGMLNDKVGPAKSDVITATLRMKQNSTFTLNLPIENNTIVYCLEGDIELNDELACQSHALIEFEKMVGLIKLKANKDSKLLLLSGLPILEPLVSHGPFVMNTQTEILEAMRDYQDGKMGYLY